MLMAHYRCKRDDRNNFVVDDACDVACAAADVTLFVSNVMTELIGSFSSCGCETSWCR
jgi:hypothetical protein